VRGSSTLAIALFLIPGQATGGKIPGRCPQVHGTRDLAGGASPAGSQYNNQHFN
jgi:hypothetical protein